MQVIFVGIRRLEFFSKKNLAEYKKTIIVSHEQIIPDWLEKSSKIIRVNEIYDKVSKVYKFNLEECIYLLSQFVRKKSDYKVFCNQESNLEIAQEIRRHFSLYDHMDGRINNFRDKLIMKKIIHSANLRAPEYLLLNKDNSLNNFEQLSIKFNGKFIIKPCSSVGSAGVFKISNKNDFINFIEKTNGDGCIYEAEEFIDGTLYEFDLAIQNGIEIYSAISRYSCPMADLQGGKSLGSIMISRSTELHKRITNFGRECTNALGAINGCFHMELFHSNKDELVFLEIAARSPGLMTVPAYTSWEGVNMYDIELSIQTNEKASIQRDISSSHISKPAFFVVFPKKNGIIKKLNTPKVYGEYKLDWAVSEGMEVISTSNNLDFAGLMFLENETEQIAEENFSYLTEHFTPIVYL